MIATAPPSLQFDLIEWSEIGPHECKGLRGRELDDDATRRLAEELRRAGMLEITELREGLSIRSTSFVGHLQLGSLAITIRPKLQGAPLIALLRYAYDLRDLHSLPRAQPALAAAGLQDILIAQLAGEARELIGRGLRRGYVRTAEPLASPRGRIDFAALAREPAGVSERLACIHYPRSANKLHNQVLKAGLRMAANLAGDPGLRTHCRRLASLVGEEVDTPRLDESLMRRLRREDNRLTASYRPAVRLIELLRKGQGVDLGEDRPTLRLPGFLFDMNRFFQALLSRFLREHLVGYELRDEYSVRGMMEYRPGWNPRNRSAPMPRPDFVVLKDRRPIATLDAKYRDLWEKSLPSEMLYQLAIYALAGVGDRKATILYPTMSSAASEAQIRIQHPLTRAPLGLVALRPVHLPTLAEQISTALSPAFRKAKTAMAILLAFGTEGQSAAIPLVARQLVGGKADS